MKIQVQDIPQQCISVPLVCKGSHQECRLEM